MNLFTILAFMMIPAANGADTWDSNPYNWDNSEYNWDNSPHNWDNSPHNWDNMTRSGIYDSTGNQTGYAVKSPTGVINLFDTNGNRTGFVPEGD